MENFYYLKDFVPAFEKMREFKSLTGEALRQRRAELLKQICSSIRAIPLFAKYWTVPLAFDLIENEFRVKGEQCFARFQNELRNLLSQEYSFNHFAKEMQTQVKFQKEEAREKALFEIVWCARLVALEIRLRPSSEFSDLDKSACAWMLFSGIQALGRFKDKRLGKDIGEATRIRFLEERKRLICQFSLLVEGMNDFLTEVEQLKGYALHYQVEVAQNDRELTNAFSKVRAKYQSGEKRRDVRTVRKFGWLLTDCCGRGLELNNKELLQVFLSELKTFEKAFAEVVDHIPGNRRVASDEFLEKKVVYFRSRLQLVVKGYDLTSQNEKRGISILEASLAALKERPGDVILSSIIVLAYGEQKEFVTAFSYYDKLLKDVTDTISRAERLMQDGAGTRLLVRNLVKFIGKYRSFVFKGGGMSGFTPRAQAFLNLIHMVGVEKILEVDKDCRMLKGLESAIYFCANKLRGVYGPRKPSLIGENTWINDFYASYWESLSALEKSNRDSMYELSYETHRGRLLVQSERLDEAQPFLLTAVKEEVTSARRWMELSEAFPRGSQNWLKCLCRIVLMPIGLKDEDRDRARAHALLCKHFYSQNLLGESRFEFEQTFEADRRTWWTFCAEFFLKKKESFRMFTQENFRELYEVFQSSDGNPLKNIESKSTDDFCRFWARQSDELLVGNQVQIFSGCVLSVVRNKISHEDYLHVWWRNADQMEQQAFVSLTSQLQIDSPMAGLPISVTASTEASQVIRIERRDGVLWDIYPRQMGVVVTVDRIRRFIEVATASTCIISVDMRRIVNAREFKVGDLCRIGVCPREQHLRVLFLEPVGDLSVDVDFVQSVTGVLQHRKGESFGRLSPSEGGLEVQVPYRLIKGMSSGRELSGRAVFVSRTSGRPAVWELLTVNQ